jgi:hypothetical protein
MKDAKFQWCLWIVNLDQGGDGCELPSFTVAPPNRRLGVPRKVICC